MDILEFDINMKNIDKIFEDFKDYYPSFGLLYDIESYYLNGELHGESEVVYIPIGVKLGGHIKKLTKVLFEYSGELAVLFVGDYNEEEDCTDAILVWVTGKDTITVDDDKLMSEGAMTAFAQRIMAQGTHNVWGEGK